MNTYACVSSPGILVVSSPASPPGGTLPSSPPLIRAHFTGQGATPTSGAFRSESDTWNVIVSTACGSDVPRDILAVCDWSFG